MTEAVRPPWHGRALRRPVPPVGSCVALVAGLVAQAAEQITPVACDVALSAGDVPAITGLIALHGGLVALVTGLIALFSRRRLSLRGIHRARLTTSP